MADGGMNIRFDPDTAAKLAAEAKALDMRPEDLAAEMVKRLLHDPIGRKLPPTQPEDYDGPYIHLDDALDAFDAEIDRRLSSRAG